MNRSLTPVHTPFPTSTKEDSKKESKKKVQILNYPYFTKCIRSELSNSGLLSCHCENCINEFFKK